MSHNPKQQSNYEKFLNTYSGNSLLKKHSLSETGTWRVRGEDPNCDMGGSHHMPELGVYEGMLQDVIEIAVDLGGFWQWGAGGDIQKVEIKAVNKTNIERLRALRQREIELKQE